MWKKVFESQTSLSELPQVKSTSLVAAGAYKPRLFAPPLGPVRSDEIEPLFVGGCKSAMTTALEAPTRRGPAASDKTKPRNGAFLAPTATTAPLRKCNAAPPLEPLHVTDAKSRGILKGIDSGKEGDGP